MNEKYIFKFGKKFCPELLVDYKYSTIDITSPSGNTLCPINKLRNIFKYNKEVGRAKFLQPEIANNRKRRNLQLIAQRLC